MKELDEVLIKIEKLLSDPKGVIERTREIDSFDFNLLTQPFGQKLPEGFEVGVFTSSKGENVPAFLPFSETNGIAFSIGISEYNPEAPCTMDELIRRADTEMYKMKASHKARKPAPL